MIIQGGGKVHGVRLGANERRYDSGEPLVISSMQHFGRLTVQGREALLSRDWERLSALIDENFDTRRKIYKLPSCMLQVIFTN